ncbi:TlpA disulfide reductase family protein [Alteribacillus sp. YIM 98480]|uniref:TlpA family protein disulfide reductase n=1 Tax=Alteribacillus sp. YIM 98480 TaxID=2606599 RepID=UPI00131CF5AF|nr:TlpA disulfide reductase family protein [Alteribacillus sp. YIM 98480]
MNYVRKRLMFLSLCGLILLTGLFYQASQNPSKEAVQVAAGYPVVETGRQAPSVDLPGLDGQTYNMETFSGKPVLFTFFSSWCGICQEELPKLSRYYEEKKDTLNIVAINATTQEYNKEDVKQFVQQAKLSIPVLLDEEGEGIEAFSVTGVPVSFLLDENGIVMDTYYGPIDQSKLEEALGM